MYTKCEPPDERNEVLVYSAPRGHTPDEVYFGKGADIPDKLERKRTEARARRLEENRRRSCGVCETEDLAIAV